MSPTLRRATLAVAAALMLAAPLPHARASSASIEIRDSYFATKYIVITVGDTVSWTNMGSSKHTVDSFPSAPQQFTSGEADPDGDGTPCNGTLVTADHCLQTGEHSSWTFGQPGTYDYYCKVHGNTAAQPDPSLGAQSQPCGMCARIVVNAPPSSPKPVKKRSPKPKVSASASPSASASASPSPTPSIFFTGGGSPIAAPRPGGGGSGGRTTFAVIVILALSGAAYATWRKFLAPR